MKIDANRSISRILISIGGKGHNIQGSQSNGAEC